MQFNTRQLVTLAVFGTLWGAVEMSLGAVLNTLHMPMSGAILAGVGLAIALIGRVFVPRRGSTLFIGAIAMLLKLFSIGGIVIGPLVGILFEALLAEIVLTIAGRPMRWAFMLSGALGVIWTLVQPFFTGWLLFGRDMFIVWLDLLDGGSRLLGLPADSAFLIVLALVVLYALIGCVAGLIAWGAARRIQLRLGHPGVTSTESH